MRTAEELTTLTLDFLAEHTNEAMAAVVLGAFWHLIWERPKHLEQIKESGEPPSQPPSQPLPDILSGQTKLRGNLKKELQVVVSQNEELERLVRELQAKLTEHDYVWSSSETETYIPLGMPSTSSRMKIRKPGIIRKTIGMTTNELDTLGSCWALLVLGFCLVAKRRTRRRYNPLSTTFLTLQKASTVAHEYAQDEIIPVLITMWIYLTKEFNEWYTRTIDPESNSGKAISNAVVYLRDHTQKLEEIMHEKVIPLSKQGVEYTRRVVDTLGTFEFLNWKEQPPTILLSDHEEKVQALEASLEQNESQRNALEEKVSTYEMALKGKEVLLYEERMKTRSEKKKATKVIIEREETRRKETRDTKESALAEVAADQRMVLCNFLSKHIESRQQQEHLWRIEGKNALKKSQIVLPNPILQGFASAMYLDSVDELNRQQESDCRDDACSDDNEYGNQTESRVREIREQFLRSKNSSRRSQTNGEKASTGSLLWGAANPDTISTTNSKKSGAGWREPSSWMEGPISYVRNWRMSGIEESRE